jgi:plasmid stabilization system protein ParE
MRAVEVSPRAAREIDRVEEWWWEHRPKAPGAVADDLASAFELLAERAEIKAPVASRGIRRLYLSRIRYYLYYRIRDERGRRAFALARQPRRRTSPVIPAK